MDGSNASEARDEITIGPPPGRRWHYFVCQGVTAEIVRLVDGQTWESRYHGSQHLLIAHERLARRQGETHVEGLPASNRQNLSRTLTFVPSGCRFNEWHEPDIPSESIYIQIDPHSALMTGAGAGSAMLASRLHFQNAVLWQTVLKVKAWIETERGTDSRYADALGVILAHELLCSNGGADATAAVRGGLTGWQRRVVGQYVEEHLAEQIPVAKLAALARLS
jgi:AraC family transcriptional regulator